jgi:hypothetical protein
MGRIDMGKMTMLAVLVMLVGLVALGESVAGAGIAAADTETLNWGSEVNAGQCPQGNLVINVTHKVINGIDSKVGGGYWATEDYNRRIQVWQVDTDEFCAVVSYQGSFVTDDGPSPQGTDTISAGITGDWEGGYRAIITGTLNSSPTNATKGNIGTFDHACDVETGVCTGLFDWTAAYFTPVLVFNYEWWGWIYHAGQNGTWVNACTSPDLDCPGNSGDITD